MNDKTLYKLEFHKVKELVKAYAITEDGKLRIDQLMPKTTLDEVKLLQEETAQALMMSVKKGRLPLSNVKPVTPVLKRVEIGAVLSGGELLVVRDALRITRQAKNYYQDATSNGETYPIIGPYFESLAPQNQVEREIARCIISPEEVADEATPELARLRRQKLTLGNRIKESLQQIIRSNAYQDMIQDPVITLRQDRYCIPIKVEYKSQFKGIVHDQSSTGATVFIEPMSVVEIGNELKGLETKEHEEIEKILTELTNMVMPYTEDIARSYQELILLDSIFARSEFSLRYDCREPKLNDKGHIELKRARHPLLPKEHVVPIDVRLGRDFTSLLITGPNTGGKTVTLKTLGLFSLMAAVGLQIPAAEGSEVAVFDGIYADLGDEQSIEQSLSTFSSHMTNVISILNDMSLNSLILLDELGSGTDPIEGAALAMSILEHLRKQQIRTVATTHYSELKLYALSTEGVENASCEFDVKSLRPTYRLLIGVPGKSNAFAISMKLGLPEYLIEDAKVYLEKENVKMEDILVDLEQSKRMAEIESERAQVFRAEAERLKEEIQKERSKIDKAKKKIMERAELKAKELLKEAEEEADRALKEVRAAARKAQVMIDEQSLQVAKQGMSETLKKQYKRASKVTGTHKIKALTSVSVGEEVMVISLMQKGVVTKEADKNGMVEVRMGIMPMKVKLADLQPIKEEAVAAQTKVNKTKQKGQISYNVRKTQSISTEVDVRGLMVDEAWPVVDKYLDDAYLAGLKQVTIIHGKGTGALRTAIMQRLKRHPHVEAQRPGTFGEGEMGVTVVTIK
ncbi:MAG: endonuclease MutS2 [Cellulosilyticum sp.]|nr:endonuclease MutS2 [Cellulosilyticum sp.]